MYRKQLASDPNADAIGADKILIVIPCLNEREHIADLISAIARDTQELNRLIVVTDGGSTDGTQSVLAEIGAREPGVIVMPNPQRIQSAGINLAVRSFGEGCRWLVRIDAHARYPKGYIETLIAEAQRTGAASVVVAMRSEGTGVFQRAVASVQNSLLGAGAAPHRRRGKARFVDHGHHALFDLSLFASLGGYDESLSHNEDAEFDIRLARAGEKIWLTRAVEIAYFPRSSLRDLSRQYFSYGRGRASTSLRHRRRPKLRQALPACIAPAAAAFLISPWFYPAALPLLCWCVLSLLYCTKFSIRLGAHGAVLAAIIAMTIHMSWSVGFWSEILSRSRRSKTDAIDETFSAREAAP